jgi:hypothetical protein
MAPSIDRGSLTRQQANRQQNGRIVSGAGCKVDFLVHAILTCLRSPMMWRQSSSYLPDM